MMLMMLRDFLSAFSSRKKGLGTLMNSLKRPRLAGLMFGVLLMCVCVGKWCPFRGVALLGQGVDDEDDNTD